MDVLDQMQELREEGRSFVLATVVRVEKPTSSKPGAKAIILADGTLTGWIGGSCAEPSVKREAQRALQEGTPRLLRLCPPEKMSTAPQEGVNEMKITCMSGGTLEIYLEPYLVQPHLIVVGHQAIAEALVRQAKQLDFKVTIIGEHLGTDRFPGADRYLDQLDFGQVEVKPNSYVVVASHGNYDELALEAFLPSPAAYVALVASKKRTQSIRSYLEQDGVAEEVLARLKYPAGLDIGAITPEEIALSILAEIVQVHRRGMKLQAAVEEAGAEQGAEAIDPVCGMTVEIGSSSLTVEHAGQTYYFCSVSCQREFRALPEKYLAAHSAG
jgi:xanthine dehydrogenase accessory factor